MRRQKTAAAKRQQKRQNAPGRRGRQVEAERERNRARVQSAAGNDDPRRYARLENGRVAKEEARE